MWEGNKTFRALLSTNLWLAFNSRGTDNRLESDPQFNLSSKKPLKFFHKSRLFSTTSIVHCQKLLFTTGDIGEWQPDGSMKIIDRKKNIFKLSQGEYVAVENLENIFGQTPGVDSVQLKTTFIDNTLLEFSAANYFKTSQNLSTNFLLVRPGLGVWQQLRIKPCCGGEPQ
jgi:hypothetical protein